MLMSVVLTCVCFCILWRLSSDIVCVTFCCHAAPDTCDHVCSTPCNVQGFWLFVLTYPLALLLILWTDILDAWISAPDAPHEKCRNGTCQHQRTCVTQGYLHAPPVADQVVQAAPHSRLVVSVDAHHVLEAASLGLCYLSLTTNAYFSRAPNWFDVVNILD